MCREAAERPNNRIKVPVFLTYFISSVSFQTNKSFQYLFLEFGKENNQPVSTRKLLLADDSVTIQKVVNLTFADEGIEVITVGGQFMA